jgi:hypothetical protein
VFLFRLALRLGRTVDELLQTVSYRELLEWQEFAAIDPFDEARGDLRNAMLMSLMANMNRDRKKHPQPFSHVEFMPFRSPPVRGPASVRAQGTGGVRVDPRTLTFFFQRAGVTKG